MTVPSAHSIHDTPKAPCWKSSRLPSLTHVP